MLSFNKLKMTAAIHNLRLLLNSTFKFKPIAVIPIRHSNYKNSQFVCDLEDIKVKYETTNSPEDWKYVARVLPPLTVPNPLPKSEYPSNWKPQAENVDQLPYFVPRTKNHMIPVYMRTSNRGMRRLTYVRRVQGNIWLLEKELREFLQKDQVRPIRSQVNELVQYICFHGDHVNAIKYYLLQNNL